jgi:transcriptional regulator with PAS, ATPase and Fis domain
MEEDDFLDVDLLTLSKAQLKVKLKEFKEDLKGAREMLSVPLKDYEYSFWFGEVRGMENLVERVRNLIKNK